MHGQKKYIMIFIILLLATISLTFAGLYTERVSQNMTIKSIASDSEVKIIEYINDHLIVGTRLYKVFCMDSSYNKVWEFNTKGGIVAIKNDNEYLYIASSDRKIYILSQADGKLHKELSVSKPPLDMAVDTQGNILVSGSFSSMKNSLYCMDKDGNELWRRDQEDAAYSVLYSGKSFIVSSGDGSIEVIDPSGNTVKKVVQKYSAADMAFNENDGSLVTISKEGWIYKYDADLKLVTSLKPHLLQGSQVISVGLELNKKRYAIGTTHGEMFVVDQSLNELYWNNDSDVRPVWSSAFSKDGGKLAISRSTGGVQVFDNKRIYSEKLMKRIRSVSTYLVVLLILALLISFATIFPKQRKFLLKLAKDIYKARVAYYILIPAFALLAVFSYYPIYQGLSKAFTDWSNISTKVRWIGLDNFKMMFEEGYFFIGIKNVFILVITTYIKILTVPILIAELIFNLTSTKSKYMYRFLFMLPMIVPGIVGALLWKTGIFEPNIGVLNSLLGSLGLENLKHNWLSDENLAIWSIVFTGFPFASIFHILIYYGGLLSIEPELFQATKIDGCSRLKSIFLIDLPLISSQIKLVLILAFISAIQDFGSVYFLTAGGPGVSTYVPGLELFYNATNFGRYGYASALGLVMFIFILGATILQMRVKASTEKL